MKQQLVKLSQIASCLEKQGNLKAGRHLTLAMQQIVAMEKVQRKLFAGVWLGKREKMLQDPDFRKLPAWQRERLLEQFETIGDGKEQVPELAFRAVALQLKQNKSKNGSHLFQDWTTKAKKVIIPNSVLLCAAMMDCRNGSNDSPQFFPDFFQLDPNSSSWVLFRFLKDTWGVCFFFPPFFFLS